MSCSSFGMPSYGTLSSGSSETPFSLSQCVEGYDFEFVPPVESRYECPVCLLILREPRQTKCGHRFCRDCILRSLRDSCTRCPVDNEPLTEGDLFPDNFAKREILNFTIRCPNSKDGCDKIVPLGKLQNHFGECLYALVPCPFKCASILPRCDMDDHIRYKCQYRSVSCEQCHVQVRACEMEAHKDVCPKAAILCPFCGNKKTREMISEHMEKECPQIEIACPFYRFGCSKRMPRMAEMEHLQADCPTHLNLLSKAVTGIIQHLKNFDGDMPCPPQFTVTDHQYMTENGSKEKNWCQHPDSHSDLASQLMAINLQSDSGWHENLEANGPRGGFNHASNEYDDGQNRITSAIYPPTARIGSDNTSPVPYSDFHTSSSMSLPFNQATNHASVSPIHHISPLSLPSDHTTVNNQNPQETRQKRQLQRINFQPHLHNSAGLFQLQPNIDLSNPQEGSMSQGSQSSEVISMIEEMSRKFEERLSAQQQKFEDLSLKYTALERTNTDLNKRVMEMEQGMSESEGRFVQGEFLWKIAEFKKYQDKAAAGEQTMLHSSPFYTSPWGYKLCIRANISTSSLDNGHLSLFVHFMQGQHDSVLSWPFSGKIVLSVLDQSPNPESCLHVIETLYSKPNLAAFQKPSTPRNHKGFGYIEFMSLSALESRNYLYNDTLVIKAQVFPDLPYAKGPTI